MFLFKWYFQRSGCRRKSEKLLEMELTRLLPRAILPKLVELPIRSDLDLPQTQGPSHAPHLGIVRVDGPPPTKRKPPQALPHLVGPQLARVWLRRRDQNLRPHRRGAPEERRPGRQGN
ncbi:hypothetical protein MRB53_015912 [Persea americana]|uniref:Uncharacterized protein n=1 Tax=Persea americana TaxID=3435 RepID=A0ACC2M0P7_PERAE|nr:hypothetical protein MRB53_015912 [Persea americana]